MSNNREKCPNNSYLGSADCYGCSCADFNDPFKDIVCRCPKDIKDPQGIDNLRKGYMETSQNPTQNGFIEYLKNIS